MASVSDGPDETSNEEKVSKEEVEGNCNGESDSKESGSSNSSSTTKPPVLKAPTFGSTFSFLGSTSSPSDGISDSSSPMQGKPFTLNPPKLSNPFLKVEKNDDAKEEDAKSKETSTPSQPNSQAEKTGNSSNKSSLSFVPLGGDSSSSKQNQSSMFAAPSSSTPALGFIFGQNIREKVEAAPAPPTPAPQEPEAGPSPPQETSEVTANGTSSEMLFSVQVPSTENSDKNNDAGKSLSEAAREYEEARAVKRKFEEVPVLTGEEEEANVIQVFAPVEPSSPGSSSSSSPSRPAQGTSEEVIDGATRTQKLSSALFTSLENWSTAMDMSVINNPLVPGPSMTNVSVVAGPDNASPEPYQNNASPEPLQNNASPEPLQNNAGPEPPFQQISQSAQPAGSSQVNNDSECQLNDLCNCLKRSLSPARQETATTQAETTPVAPTPPKRLCSSEALPSTSRPSTSSQLPASSSSQLTESTLLQPIQPFVWSNTPTPKAPHWNTIRSPLNFTMLPPGQSDSNSSTALRSSRRTTHVSSHWKPNVMIKVRSTYNPIVNRTSSQQHPQRWQVERQGVVYQRLATSSPNPPDQNGAPSAQNAPSTSQNATSTSQNATSTPSTSTPPARNVPLQPNNVEQNLGQPSNGVTNNSNTNNQEPLIPESNPNLSISTSGPAEVLPVPSSLPRLRREQALRTSSSPTTPSTGEAAPAQPPPHNNPPQSNPPPTQNNSAPPQNNPPPPPPPQPPANMTRQSITYFCHFIQARLSSLDHEQRIVAERLIHDVLFEAELGNLTRNSSFHFTHPN